MRRRPNAELFPQLNKAYQHALNKNFIGKQRFFQSTPNLLRPYVIFRHINPTHGNGLYDANLARYPKFSEKNNQELARMIFRALEAHLTEAAKELKSEIAKFPTETTIVSLSSPEGCYQTPRPIEDYYFEAEILEPLKSLCADLPSWLHFHFGTMAVAVKPTCIQKYETFIQEVHVPREKIGQGIIFDLEDLNKLCGDDRPKMMSVALYGECDKGVVDYYTKGSIFHADPHIRTHEQVIAKDKLSIIPFKLSGENYIKQLVIGGDYTSKKQEWEFRRFFALNPCIQYLPTRGYTDVINAGMNVQLRASACNAASLREIRFDKALYTEKRSYSSNVKNHWPVPGTVKTYERIQFGDLAEAAKKWSITSKSVINPTTNQPK